jgi:chromosome segregation protein
MLAALELNGFKSFADRTRFEFPAGITIVVGPNGSGKSNVVDAIKWVLGAQSVRSLRGKEMTDVIFSGSRTRRQAGAAEASLILNNTAGLLDHDAAEIQITRRVYRSGEGEYLLNRRPCRLRDIRDLLAGAGISTGGYSIIEQGRVDAVLQASPTERRLIFEEAAGISRFRMKREEAARRLERVQQNLLRLGDIVEELQSRLQTVRAQAARARRYNELSNRVEALRTQLGLEDWRQLTNQIDAQRDVASREEAAAGQLEQQLADGDARVAEIDAEAESLDGGLREALSAEAAIRERLAQCDSARSSHLARIDELEHEVVRLSHQLLVLTSRAGDSRQLVEETREQLEASRASLAGLQARSAESLARVAATETAVDELRVREAEASAQLDAIQRETIQLQTDRKLVDEKLQGAKSALVHADEEAANLARLRQRLAAESKHTQSELTRRTEQFDQAAAELQAAAHELSLDRARLTDAFKRVAEVNGRLTAVRERTAVLEELEARLDGLTSGAKEVLRAAREEPDGPFRHVRGVVADLFHVDADTAPLVEIALGERANYLVVAETKSLAPALAGEPNTWPGRTTFLRLDVSTPASAVDRIDLSSEAGVMGRADQFVETTPDLAPLVRRLLGRHWLVNSLGTAIQLAGGVGRGLNFVTVAGEALLADGTLAVGPRQSVAGLLSRRSELRVLRDEIEALQASAAEAERAGALLEQRIAQGESAVREITARHDALQRTHGELRLRMGSLTDKLEQLDVKISTLAAERTALTGQIEQLAARRDSDERRLEELQRLDGPCRATLGETQEKQEELAAQLATLRQSLTDERVELARGEQRVEGLARQMEQLERDHAERDRGLAETRARAAECQAQRSSLQQTVQSLAAEAQALRQQREQLALQAAELENLRRACHENRTASMAAADRTRAQFLAVQGRVQTARLQLQQCEHARTMLAQRMREDYQLDLEQVAARHAEPAGELATPPLADRGAVEAEIRELRDQLQASGPVNLESLTELEALEGRSGGLVAQFEDLHDARLRLEQIIHQINGESRQLFVDTTNEVRGHFQEIFRRLFGGGEADLVIEEDASGDVLECGVSIIARPPGKQPRNISLLSGGERTLTCVALLLAIFRSRPSPFCVLDEVDAALDEANIDRFCNLLKEFMQQTQFIVITHSKRTMTCSDTLHGVTMQESGVSKRVSVRFEDVGEGGRIRASALGAAGGGERGLTKAA